MTPQYIIDAGYNHMMENGASELIKQAFIAGAMFVLNDWVKVDKNDPSTYPPKNLGVIVFIPEEDFHITSGMWDVSEKWVLLDEYREPECEVTHWKHSPAIPKEYQKQVEENNQVMKALKKLIPPQKLSELATDIRSRQILSAEEMVIENLRKKGLLPTPPKE
jgi:hypothetical protein